MTNGYWASEKKVVEESLISQRLDFTATYMAIKKYRSLILTSSSFIDKKTIYTLTGVLKDNRHFKEKKAYFLYREAADSLVCIIKNADDKKLADHALSTIKETLSASTTKKHRAIAEAMGSFPLEIKRPELPHISYDHTPKIKWQALLECAGINDCTHHRWTGRSLVSDTDNGYLLVVKMLRHDDLPSLIGREGEWMDFLQTTSLNFSKRFDLPVPIRVENQYICQIEHLPLAPPENANLPEKRRCLVFLAHKDYFIYPNEPCGSDTVDEDNFKEIIFRNAWLLGRLTGMGIIHTALVPLFHNRVQQDRREDNGVYLWERGGRLDRWLESCRYPNFGKTGLRDFEHFESFSGNIKHIYHHIGSQLLSLVLVAGSFYRTIGPDLIKGFSSQAHANNLLKQKKINRSGIDKNGNPFDARILFNDTVIKQILTKIFKCYYCGFTGNTESVNDPVDFDKFSKRLTHEMGVDTHMEEVLRSRDQELMTEEAFSDFLSRRGQNPVQDNHYIKGEKDIITLTGPHLGGFNQKISLPELTDFLASASAVCIADKYFTTKQQML